MNTTNVVKLISDSDREIYETVNLVFVTSAISLCGLVANIMNIVVFYKQGFDSSMNISFFGLAISDLCSLITVLWFNTCVNPLFVHSDAPMYPPEILHLTGGIPHICFVRITGWITVFITAERCLCIAVPLKVKQIITPRVTKITVCIIYILMMASFVPEYQTTFIDWKFYPHRNQTLLGLVFTSDRQTNEGVVFFLYSMLGLTSFMVVIVLTCVLVIKLQQKTIWRMKAHLDKTCADTISNRDKKAMNMVVMIAIVLIVCYTPGVIISMASFLNPEFSVAGQHANVFYVTWCFAFIFDAINSSVNIFLYYNMSSKYRSTFRELFLRTRIEQSPLSNSA